MKNNKLGLKVMAALLAVAIVGSFAITTNSNNLRAMEGDEGFVEEAPAEVVQEVFVEPEPEVIPEEPAEQPAEEAPAEEPAEQPAEEAPEEPTAEEPAEEAEAEEEEPFDVVAAYEHYMSLDEYGKIEYLNSLSDANREELKRYIEMKEAEAKAAEEPKEEEKQEEPAEELEEEPEKVEEDYTFDVNIWYETEGKLTYGATVVWKSSVNGVKDGDAVSYQWQVDKGNGWEDIPGATDPEYVMTLSKENAKYNWRLIANAK